MLGRGRAAPDRPAASAACSISAADWRSSGPAAARRPAAAPRPPTARRRGRPDRRPTLRASSSRQVPQTSLQACIVYSQRPGRSTTNEAGPAHTAEAGRRSARARSRGPGRRDRGRGSRRASARDRRGRCRPRRRRGRRAALERVAALVDGGRRVLDHDPPGRLIDVHGDADGPGEPGAGVSSRHRRARARGRSTARQAIRLPPWGKHQRVNVLWRRTRPSRRGPCIDERLRSAPAGSSSISPRCPAGGSDRDAYRFVDWLHAGRAVVGGRCCPSGRPIATTRPYKSASAFAAWPGLSGRAARSR